MIPGVFAAQAVNQAPRLWTPADLPVLPMVWIDWDSAVTAVSGRASMWSNSRGSLGGAFSQGTSGNRPEILSAELNGRRAIRFDAANRWMGSSEVAGFARNSAHSNVIVVIRPRTKESGAGCVLGINTAGSGARARINCGYGFPGANSMYGASQRRDSTDPEALVSATVPAGAWSIVQWGYGYSANTMTIRVNAGAPTTISPAWPAGANTSNTASGHPARIGEYPTGGNSLDGDIALMLCIEEISSTDREKVEGWAAWQLGLEGSLPINHPYKDAPPYV